jgi:pimeloyl-ACP methyl ester carboxylesterase
MPFANTPTGSLHYEVCDRVPPWRPAPETIVFHHGIAADVHLWTHWQPVLMPHFRLVCFDMRGFGRSAQPTANFVWSFDQLVDDLLAVVEASETKKFHLVGESIGGTVALVCALREPQRLLSLCMSNAAARGGLVGNVVGWRDEVAQFGQTGWAERMMQRRFYAGALDADLHAWYRRLHETCSIDATLALAQLLLDADLTPRLGEVSVPTLLLSPDGSPFIPAQVMAAMHAQIPGARLQVFARSKHGLPLSHGADCARTLLGFLATRHASS